MRFWVLVIVLLVLNYLSVAIFAPGREESVTIPYNPTSSSRSRPTTSSKISTTGESVSGEFKKEFKPSTDTDAKAAKNFETQIPTFADNETLSRLLSRTTTSRSRPSPSTRGAGSCST